MSCDEMCLLYFFPLKSYLVTGYPDCALFIQMIIYGYREVLLFYFEPCVLVAPWIELIIVWDPFLFCYTKSLPLLLVRLIFSLAV